MPSSWFTGMLGYLLGNTAELKNFDKVISSGEGREVTRVKSVGYVKVKFNVTLVNFEKFGYYWKNESLFKLYLLILRCFLLILINSN